MKLTIQSMGEMIHKFFHEGVEKVAKETKFVQRVSKLTGIKFVQALVFHSLEKPMMTLSSLTQSCLDLGVSISEQGLDERINEQSVAFLQRLFAQAVQRWQAREPLPVGLLEQFTSVYLVDSSQISLPASMAGLFPGAGGSASPASLKIQLVFDYLHGHLAQVEFASGCEPDQGYRGHHAWFAPGVLLLMDLGYFVLDTFKAIHEQQAYFLSRFQAQTAILTPAGERLALTELLAAQTENLCAIDVLIGSRKQHQIPTRLILIRLPQEVADRQRHRAKANARRRGYTSSPAHLQLLDWALFITNVPPTLLRTEHVAALYRLRWQIELVFKLCKSLCALDHLAAQRSQRILTELYARLIGVVLTYFLLAPLRLPTAHLPNRTVSPTQVRLTLQRFARLWLRALHQPQPFLDLLLEFFRHVAHAGFMQKRRQDPNALHALALLSASYHVSTLEEPDFDWLATALALS